MQTLKIYNHKGPNFEESFEYLSDALIQVPFVESIFELTNNVSEADLIPIRIFDPYLKNDTVLKILSKFSKEQCVVEISQLTGASEESSSYKILVSAAKRIENILTENGPAFIILHNNAFRPNDAEENSPILQYTNFVFNRHVAFYVDKPQKIFEYDKHSEIGHWYPHKDNLIQKDAYELGNLELSLNFARNLLDNRKREIIPKSFIYAAMIRDAAKLNQTNTFFSKCEDFNFSQYVPIRSFLRNELFNKLKDYAGYIGNPAFGNFLHLQNSNQFTLDYANKLINFSTGFWPLDNSYYESSVITITVETISLTCDVKFISEKCYEPLIKGHFLLPFGYSGLIDDIKNMGFKLPNWIDYHYDREKNDLLRWSMFLNNAVLPTVNLSPFELFQKKINDIDILIHNRNLFFSGYRDTIKSCFEKWASFDHSKKFHIRTKIL